MNQSNHRLRRLVVCALFALVSANMLYAGEFLVNQRNASSQWSWTPGGGTTLFHQVRANDVDLNPAQGSSYGWIAEHYSDHFGRFVPGSGSGLESQYDLGSGGRTQYAYPKHITVFDNSIIVMSRNDATIYRYDENGNQLTSVASGNGTGQGMATDGSSLFVSFWNGTNSFIERFDSSLVYQERFANPTGMGALTNIVDFAYDPGSGHFFGLAADFEQGTVTESDTVLEFQMGGAVVASHTLPFLADGIGQIPEPATLSLLICGALALLRRRRAA